MAVAAAILLSGGALSVSTAAPAQAATQMVTANTKPSAVAERIVAEINNYRAQAGLPPYKLAPKVSSISQRWAETSASEGSLTINPDACDELTVIGAEGTAEFMDSGAAYTEVVKRWMSYSQMKNHLLWHYTHIGIGYAVDAAGEPYYTVDFGYFDTATAPSMVEMPKNVISPTGFTSSWTPKTGEKVTDYIVQVWRADGSLLSTKTSSSPKAAFTGLTPNTAYTVGVTARAIDGAGLEYRSPVQKYTVSTLKDTPVSAPNAPTNLKVVSTTSSDIALSWVAPTGVVGSLSGYTVTLKKSGQPNLVFKTTTPSIKIANGLTEATSYAVEVAANVNSADGTKSVTTPAAKVAAKTTLSLASTVKVAAPTSVVTTSSQSKVTATWKAPTVTGKVTSYTVTLKQGTTVIKTYTTTSLKASFSGLKANTSYKVEVKANAISSNGKNKATSSTAWSSTRTLK